MMYFAKCALASPTPTQSFDRQPYRTSVSFLNVSVARRFHRYEWVRLTQPKQREANQSFPIFEVQNLRVANLGATCGYVGQRDRQHGLDIGPISKDQIQGRRLPVLFELRLC
jgi:hypothetical protein